MSPRLSERLIKRKSLLWPTPTGWLSLGLGFAFLCVGWWFDAERFLSTTDRVRAEYLVVDGWIGASGVRAAADEFHNGHYDFMVATGGVTSNRWGDERWSYAETAAQELVRIGIPPAQILVAKPVESQTQRTFETAVAVAQVVHANTTKCTGIELFTLGPHARRSRVIYEKVLGRQVDVGVIGWRPSSELGAPWWSSSERAEDLLKETIAYAFEVTLNSGRLSNKHEGQARGSKR